MIGAQYTTGIRAVTVNVDPPSITTASEASQAVTVPGVQPGDLILALSPAGPSDARYYSRSASVTAADEVTILWTNETAGTVNPAALNITFLFLPASASAGFPMGYAK